MDINTSKSHFTFLDFIDVDEIINIISTTMKKGDYYNVDQNRIRDLEITPNLFGNRYYSPIRKSVSEIRLLADNISLKERLYNLKEQYKKLIKDFNFKIDAEIQAKPLSEMVEFDSMHQLKCFSFGGVKLKGGGLVEAFEMEHSNKQITSNRKFFRKSFSDKIKLINEKEIRIEISDLVFLFNLELEVLKHEIAHILTLSRDNEKEFKDFCQRHAIVESFNIKLIIEDVINDESR